MRVIGTAGHVDHGKSTLVAALTGIHPDRLKEEQAREMTIELGFAWFNLPDGEEVGIVDVPGHRDFIENMLAGVGGMDACLFVIAADEGIMPQTREHLAIINLLHVPAGIVVLTKIDLVDDPEWLSLVEADIHQVMVGTMLENAPVVHVSARTGQGIAELKLILQECLRQSPLRVDQGRARLPVDRVFTVAGFGTVVTGTLLDGSLHVGEEVEILPSGLKARIRGLQTHKKKEETAQAGSRTAVNLSGVVVEELVRGDIVAPVGKYLPTLRLDARLRLLADAAWPVRHNDEVKFFLGAAEVVGRVRLLGLEELLPGQDGWIQLELHTGVVAVRGDRFILRRPSPAETIGGGVVVDARPTRRHKRYDDQVLSALQALLEGSPAEVLLQTALQVGLVPLKEVLARTHLSTEQVQAALSELQQLGSLLFLENSNPGAEKDALVVAASRWQIETGRAEDELRAYHQQYPLRRGMPREELKSHLQYSTRLINAALRRWLEHGNVVNTGGLLSLPGFVVHFSPPQELAIERLLAKFAASPFNPPALKDCQAQIGEELTIALLDQGLLVEVSAEVVLRKGDYEELVRLVEEHFVSQPTLSVAQLRDRIKSSRRVVLPFLEHLDRIGLTLRDGDVRRKLTQH